MSESGIITRLYKEILHLNNKNTSQLRANNLNRYFFKEDKHMANKHIVFKYKTKKKKHQQNNHKVYKNKKKTVIYNSTLTETAIIRKRDNNK